MIEKLKPREMIRVSLVAKKLHEVIDCINEIGDKIESRDDSKIQGEGNREDTKIDGKKK